MNRIVNSDSLLGVSKVFSLLSTQKSLCHEQRLQFKQSRRPHHKVTIKHRSSESVYDSFPWICGDAEKNTYYCWPCLVMGDLTNVYHSLFFLTFFNLLQNFPSK